MSIFIVRSILWSHLSNVWKVKTSCLLLIYNHYVKDSMNCPCFGLSGTFPVCAVNQMLIFVISSLWNTCKESSCHISFDDIFYINRWNTLKNLRNAGTHTFCWLTSGMPNADNFLQKSKYLKCINISAWNIYKKTIHYCLIKKAFLTRSGAAEADAYPHAA